MWVDEWVDGWAEEDVGRVMDMRKEMDDGMDGWMDECGRTEREEDRKEEGIGHWEKQTDREPEKTFTYRLRNIIHKSM